MVKKFENYPTKQNLITKNDVVISLADLLDGYTEIDLPIKQLKRYDGGFSIIMEDDTVFDVTVAEGEPYYY